MTLPPLPALPAVPAASSWRVVRVGGVLLLLLFVGLWAGSRAGLWASSPHPLSLSGGYRLTLTTESLPNCYYGSAWNDGEVVLAHDASDGKTVTLTSRYDFEDGCTWEATETLTPDGAGYSYAYAERPVACTAGAMPAAACARVGSVRVTPHD
jgi:hypothetical protein